MKSVFKVLTFISLIVASVVEVSASVLVQENQKTHLRWKIESSKDQVNISKKGNSIFIQSLDADFFESFAEDFAKLNLNKKYHDKYIFTKPKVSGSPFKLELNLKNNSIELFSFYESKTKKYVLDFWINQDIVKTKSSALSAKPKKIKIAPLNTRKKKVKNRSKVSAKPGTLLAPKRGEKFNIIDADKISGVVTGKGFRDFRYGGAFIWDYKALIPPLERDLSLKEKTPDYFFKIKDREYLEDKKESHMQLTINFYNKKKWGLMTKSIGIYENKYGKTDSNRYLNDYMKAVSMLKNVLKEDLKPKYLSKIDENGEIVAADDFSKKGIQASARNILSNVLDLSKDYELNKAILRYLIQHSRDEEDYIQALDYAKRLYVKSTGDFDDDMIVYSSRVILNSLTNLRQLGKVKSFLGNKAVLRVLPKQEGLAYISYVQVENNKTSDMIARYKVEEKSLSKPVHPSIIFNTAESYFREAKYKKALQFYDRFLSSYSYLKESSYARVRMALSYDLLDKPYKEVIKLYETAINKSSNLEARVEAKIRYVGLRVNRNKNISNLDKETISFLNLTEAEKNFVTPSLRKLLWLTRLRSMIVTGKHEEALAYLSALPIENLRRVDQRSFYADGAEVVLGVIQAAYLNKEYSRAVKIWELYKNKYEDKVLSNPYVHFLVSDSYIKLSLYKSFQRSFEKMAKLKDGYKRTFPLWIKPHKSIAVKDLMLELRLNKFLQEKDYKGLGTFLDQNKKNSNINYKFYKGLVAYQMKEYNSSVTSFESILVTPNRNNSLSPEQSRLLVKYYLESLYETAKPAKFRKNVLAIAGDLRREDNKQLKNILARAEYLFIESLFSEKNVDYKSLKVKAKAYIEEYKNSNYISRVTYLQGIALINTEEVASGKEQLERLIGDEKVPAYLKGLARSELSTLELKKKTLNL